MNLKTTLQRVLAEFEKNGWEKMCRYDNEPDGAVMIDLESAKSFISQALTESLKEFSAAIEIEKTNHKFWDGYFLGGEDSPEIKAMNKGYLAALQAIEEKKQKYLKGE